MRPSALRFFCLRLSPPNRNSSCLKLLRQNSPVLTAKRDFQLYAIGFNYKKDSEAQADEDDVDEEKARQRKRATQTALSTRTYFNAKEKNKETFESMLDLYHENNPNKRGLVEFIYTAVKYMDEYSVSYDLQTYKKLIKLLPDEKYVPQNWFQEGFYHFPKQQDCITSVLDHMESKGVCPDVEMINILKKIFGPTGHPTKKAMRMLYWIPKFKNASPWPVPFPPVSDRFLLSKLAIERIVSVDPQSVVSVYQTKTLPDALDDTFVVNGQSPTQQRLLESHPTSQSLYVEGAFRIWLGRACVNYFILRADVIDEKKFHPEPQDPDDISNFNNPFAFDNVKAVIKKPSVHEQRDGTIMAVCATGSSSRDSLLSWIRLLEQNGNSCLGKIPVIFSLKSPLGEVVPLDNGPVPPPDDDTEKLTDA